MNNKKGFTLTEILIVMVVAGILLALILPNTLRAIERGNVTALRNDINSIDTALFMCFSEERNWASCDSLTKIAPYLGGAAPINPFASDQTAAGNGYDVDGDNVNGYRAVLEANNYPKDIEDDIIANKLFEETVAAEEPVN